MTKLLLDLTKSIDENAAVYFERAKKVKKKIEGAEKALMKTQQPISRRQKK